MADYHVHLKGDQSLCWRCKNCFGGCSWSESFEPVEGWSAERTLIKHFNVETPSFLVRACPLFAVDDGEREYIDSDGFQNLMEAIYKRAAQDYVLLLDRLDVPAYDPDGIAKSKIKYQLSEIENLLPRWLTDKIKRERKKEIEDHARPGRVHADKGIPYRRRA